MSYLQDALTGLKQVQVGLDAMQELDLGPETKAKLQLLIDNAQSCMAECRSLSAAYSALRERTERGEDVGAHSAPLDERVRRVKEEVADLIEQFEGFVQDFRRRGDEGEIRPRERP